MNMESNTPDPQDENESSKPLMFVVVYYLMSILSIIVHIWVTVRGWSEDGIWWGLLYLACFIYAEIYWAYRAFPIEGLSIFVIASFICGIWWIMLLLGRKKLEKWMSTD